MKLVGPIRAMDRSGLAILQRNVLNCGSTVRYSFFNLTHVLINLSDAPSYF